jgi:hypothetical protein
LIGRLPVSGYASINRGDSKPCLGDVLCPRSESAASRFERTLYLDAFTDPSERCISVGERIVVKGVHGCARVVPSAERVIYAECFEIEGCPTTRIGCDSKRAFQLVGDRSKQIVGARQ